MKNHYETLGLSPAATTDRLRASFAAMVLKIQGQPDFEKRFKELQEAYDILSNPISKKAFDLELRRFYENKCKHPILGIGVI